MSSSGSSGSSRPSRLVEWYRVDRAQTIRRVLVGGATAMALGSLIVGISFSTHQSERARIASAIAAFVAIAAGPAIVLLGLRRPLAEDLYIGIRTDGVILHFDEPEIIFAWDAIARVRFDRQAQVIVFELREGSEHVLAWAFSGIAREALAQRLDECRRKSGFALLR